MNTTIGIEETNIGTHAILATSENKIILQKRSNDLNIANPGKIGMFGGTIKKDEPLKSSLKRELLEELELDIKGLKIKKLGTYKKTKDIDGMDYTTHVFTVEPVEIKKLKLHEGVGFVVGKPKELLLNKKLTRVTRLAVKDYLVQIKN